MSWVAIILVELVLLGLAVYFFRSSQREKARFEARQAMQSSLPELKNPDFQTAEIAQLSPLQSWWLASSEGLPRQHLMLGAVAAVLVPVVALALRGLIGFASAVFLVVVGGYLLLALRRERRRRAMLGQIPVFNDLVLRSLASGKGLEWAIRNATEELTEPLRSPMMSVMRAVEAGAGLSQALHTMSQRYKLAELSQFAMAIHISYNYGSNPRQLLQNVSAIIRRNDQIRRELASMTGETRLTAWVLGLVPVAMVVYLNFASPNYLGSMLADPSGRWVLFTGVAFQVAGVFAMWRMVKSLG